MSPNSQKNIEQIHYLPVYSVRPDPNQPRKNFDERSLNELAESIKQHGLLQPIQVRSCGDGTYIIVHGERRWRAHKIAQLLTIKAIVSDIAESEAKNAQVIENLIREDLSDMEMAKEFQRRVDLGATHEQIAKTICKSRAFVTQRLSLLRLPQEMQEQLEKGKITFDDARNSKSAPETRQCYAVTIEKLEVYKLFQQPNKPDLNTLHEAYRKDLVAIRRALT
jgi:ParB family chromosome partitioning protein